MPSQNHPNPSRDGFGASPSAKNQPNQHGAVNEGVQSGRYGEDQSVRDYREPNRNPSNSGNRFPGMPPIRHGN